MHTIISTWSELLGQLFPMFTKPGAKIFANLMTGWVLCTARRTITGILPFADPMTTRAHDAYHRFFPDARWMMSRLWQKLTWVLIAYFCPKGIMTLALDDTLFHHSGQKMEGAGAWRDAVRSTKKKVVYARGLNLVVLTLQIQPPWGGEPLGLPINMRLHKKNQKTLIELAVEMIQEVRGWVGQRSFRVVGDGFYATLVGKSLPNVTIISRIRRDANLYDLLPKKKKRKGRGRPRTKGKQLAKLEKMAAHIQHWTTVEYRQRGTMVNRLVYTRIVLWPSVTKNPIKLVISRDPRGSERGSERK
ncbi:transposase [Planctomycetota bacterium]